MWAEERASRITGQEADQEERRERDGEELWDELRHPLADERELLLPHGGVVNEGLGPSDVSRDGSSADVRVWLLIDSFRSA